MSNAHFQYVNVSKCWMTQTPQVPERNSRTFADIPAPTRDIYQHTCLPIGHGGYLRCNASTHVVP